MGLLSIGAKPGMAGGGNALLNAFLNSGGSGTTDLGTVMKFAGRFLNPPQETVTLDFNPFRNAALWRRFFD